MKQHIFILADSRIFVFNQKIKVNFAHEFICPFFLAKRVENNVKSSTLKRRNSCKFFYMQTKCHVFCLFVCFLEALKKVGSINIYVHPCHPSQQATVKTFQYQNVIVNYKPSPLKFT